MCFSNRKEIRKKFQCLLLPKQASKAADPNLCMCVGNNLDFVSARCMTEPVDLYDSAGRPVMHLNFRLYGIFN